jgi:hypothetical protein
MIHFALMVATLLFLGVIALVVITLIPSIVTSIFDRIERFKDG